jgi:hypothetical protein
MYGKPYRGFESLSLRHLLRFERLDNLGTYTASRSETGLFIPSDYER